VTALKDHGEDNEWYPTTPEIIRQVAKDLRSEIAEHDSYRRDTLNILDIGAGDGRVLVGLKEQLDDGDRFLDHDIENLFAIEVSTVHLTNMPKEIVVLGTEFHEQTLVDKPASVVFCNPPYSEFETWTHRILRECPARRMYFVIPTRWRDSKRIEDALKSRGVETHSIGEFDFETADRRARATVEVVRFFIPDGDGTSVFDAAIEDMLPELERFDDAIEPPDDPARRANMIEGKEGGVIPTMVAAYDAELATLVAAYRAVVKIEPAILKELAVTKATILEGLRSKINGLKNRYWASLFNHLDAITNRLATKQRKEFLASLTDKAVIDFTEGNILSMLVWVSKWATDHFDQQLIDLYQAMSQKATVERYKSNQKVFANNGWRYLREHETHYKLCFRMVLEIHGGIAASTYSYDCVNGLCRSSAELLGDFITVANNLGFPCNDNPANHQWKSNRKVEFYLNDGRLLMDVRAFKNGNLHIRVAKNVMLAINVQAGKLLGWLRTAQEAVTELQAEGDEEFVCKAFSTSHRISPTSLLRIGLS